MTDTKQAPAPAGVEVNGAAVRERRKSLGHTISALAPKIPISVGYLSQIERGWRKTVAPPTFLALAAALGLADNPDAIKKAA